MYTKQVENSESYRSSRMESFVDNTTFEPKPGFSLIKYGAVYALNFNEEFAQRLTNILKDSDLPQPVQSFSEQLAGGDWKEEKDFDIVKFEHVYSVAFTRDFAQQLNQVLSQFLVQHRISPALFSFAKQLEAVLYPRKFDSKTAYADE